MSNTKSREFLLVWDSTMANPNGDMLNENRPRQDEVTGQLEVSDVRVKRFAREEWINKGENVLVQTVEEKGKIQTCQKRVETIQKQAKIKDDDLEKYLTDNYIDVKLFGAVITKPKRDILGPLQVAWSKSVHEAQIKFMQGNAAYASSEGKSQASIWGKYISPYALFKTYAIYNNLVAKKQNIDVDDKDIETQKVQNAVARVRFINEEITSRAQMKQYNCHEGALPFTKSYLLRPLSMLF